MGSIPKIVSTPLKWVSRQFLHRTLLRFPGGSPQDPIACTYCPEMCRFSCPTAVASGNDAVTPCNKTSLLHKEKLWPGKAAAGGELWPLYDCTGCGRCTDYCVHGVPVAELLFNARKDFGWKEARELAARITDAEDRVGDLADELGDRENALRRLASLARPGGVLELPEARSVFFAGTNGHSATLSWQDVLLSDAGSAPLTRLANKLAGKRWLVAESPWLNRRLGRVAQVERYLTQLETQVGPGVLVYPFQRGKDCIDTGGEGAYARLFPAQARVMALDLWERDAGRADGVLTFSERAASWLRACLPKGVPVLSVPEATG